VSLAACPICRKPSLAEYRPFCSRRCADVDLQRWLTGRYVLDDTAGAEDDPARIEDDDDA
jgi:endogenous inhibitor of DNA gyrase (YacG/DUF329 family)